MKNQLFLSIIILVLLGCQPRKSGEESTETQMDEEKITASVSEAWATDSIFRVPESVLYDKDRDIIFVSNIDGQPSVKDQKGFISKLKPNGEIEELEWVTGLNAPKGMAVFKNFLYVTDITEVVVINIEEAAIVENYMIPGAVFLNDITIDNKGVLYVSDSDTDKIHLISEGLTNVWLEEGDLNRPNGLYWVNGEMMLASMGDKQFKKIDMESKEISVLTTGIGDGDGVAMDKMGNFVVSSWSGQVFYIEKDGSKHELINTTEQNINSADIDMMVDKNIILVPTFFDDRVVAYNLTVN